MEETYSKAPCDKCGEYKVVVDLEDESDGYGTYYEITCKACDYRPGPLPRATQQESRRRSRLQSGGGEVNPSTISTGMIVLRGIADKYGVVEEAILDRGGSLRLREARRALYLSLRSLGWTWWRIGGFCKRHPEVVRRTVERREESKGRLKVVEEMP